jgi:hypothetical protein
MKHLRKFNESRLEEWKNKIKSERDARGFTKAPDNIKLDEIEDDINLLKKTIPEKNIETIGKILKRDSIVPIGPKKGTIYPKIEKEELVFRLAVKSGKYTPEELDKLVSLGAKICDSTKKLGLAWCIEMGNYDLVENLIKKYGCNVESSIRWLTHTPKINDEEKEKAIDFLEKVS